MLTKRAVAKNIPSNTKAYLLPRMVLGDITTNNKDYDDKLAILT